MFEKGCFGPFLVAGVLSTYILDGRRAIYVDTPERSV